MALNDRVSNHHIQVGLAQRPDHRRIHRSECIRRKFGSRGAFPTTGGSELGHRERSVFTNGH
jgi:hypothetical protein